MTRTEILRFDRMPFDSGIQAEELEYGADLNTKKIHLVLFLRYMARFAADYHQDIPVPRLDYVSPILGYSKAPKRFDWAYEKTKRSIMEELFEGVLLSRGWGYYKMQSAGSGAVPEIHAAKMPAVEERDEIWRVFKKDMPALCGQEISCIYLCWNERLCHFKNFSETHPKAIKKIFKEEAALIERLRRRIADPLAAGFGTEFCGYGKGCYCMAFYEGTIDAYEFSFLDMDYNFFIQVILLDLLLQAAEEEFGYLGDRK